jgi:hypothetical protein
MTTAPLWDQLVAAAVLGTERRPFTGHELPGPLRSLANVDSDLVTAASAIWAYREAGRVPLPDRVPATGGPAPDERPLLPAGTVRALNAVLEDRRYRAILPEWLTLANRIGGRLPPEMIPILLDARRDEDPRHLRQLTGPLGPWLAQHNPDWAWIAAAAGERDPGLKEWTSDALAAAWEGGDLDRLAAFAAYRATHPAAAREFLRQVWSTEPPSTRAALVRALDDGLSLDDERFLDHLLQDRRKDVRAAAAGLLSKLPGSRLMAASEAKALAQVHIEGRRRPAMHVEPDGVEESAGATRLTAWPEQLKTDPLTLVRMALRSGASGLVRGWAVAAVRQRDAIWAEALIEGGAPATGDLIQVLPSSTADRVLNSLLKDWGLSQCIEVLLQHPIPWSPALTDSVIGHLRSMIESGDISGGAAVRDALPALGLAFAAQGLQAASALPDALEHVPEAGRPAAETFWTRRIGDLLAVLHFRHAMYQEFR